MGGPRGRITTHEDRQKAINFIDEARNNGARLIRACSELKITPRTFQRWRLSEHVADGRKAAAGNRTPANKISAEEQERILTICNTGEFADMSPNQIVPALADQGIYVASESSFYRVLRQADQLSHRGKAKRPSHSRPDPITADAPNQVWSWDITYMATTVRGLFFYLYMIMDVYSRKIVGWEIFDTESSEHASTLFRKTYIREGIAGENLTLHSDNGSPMKGATMLATLQKLGVMPSFSRPSVSNDNAYSEALFKTLKYHPGFPEKPFENIDTARKWVYGFQHWYNEVHHHSALKFVTPGQRHRGEDYAILAQRQIVYESARRQNPERWSGKIRDWKQVGSVGLNNKMKQPKSNEVEQKSAA